eukprot:scaffold2591_cov417-Prasinococcus_capsulatus_cf.AAC.6
MCARVPSFRTYWDPRISVPAGPDGTGGRPPTRERGSALCLLEQGGRKPLAVSRLAMRLHPPGQSAAAGVQWDRFDCQDRASVGGAAYRRLYSICINSKVCKGGIQSRHNHRCHARIRAESFTFNLLLGPLRSVEKAQCPGLHPPSDRTAGDAEPVSSLWETPAVGGLT